MTGSFSYELAPRLHPGLRYAPRIGGEEPLLGTFILVTGGVVEHLAGTITLFTTPLLDHRQDTGAAYEQAHEHLHLLCRTLDRLREEPPRQVFPEEIGRAAADRYSLCQIAMATPTTTDQRLGLVGSAGSGFLYVVSVAGVTGARDHLAVGVANLLERIRSRTTLPLAVGFGVSRPEHMQAIAAAGGDAAIVGSAIAAIIEEHTPDTEQMFKALRAYMTMMQGSLKPGSEIGSDFRSEGEPEERIP